jgi:hypothetical protein
MLGAHAAAIVALAVTADGTAVASADRLGGIRLWTTLDGSREPVVIAGTAPRALTIERDGDGFALGTLDAAGGVHVIRTSAVGAVRARVTVGERPALEIASTREGLLILRADQTVELVDAAGAVRARLAPDPGTHIDSILVRGGRALALTQEDKQLRGRWIVLDHGARWGATTPKFRVKVAHAVLSPDGDRLAVSRPHNLHPVLIDLATGAALPTPLCVSRAWPHENGEDVDESELLRGDNAPMPLGFLTGDVVACAVASSLQWWNTSGAPEPMSASSFPIVGTPLVTTDRTLLAGLGPSLVIGSPSATKFLGYGVHDVSHVRVADGGLVVTGGDQQSLVLDADLRERARIELGRVRVDWTDIVLLDDRYAITASQLRTPKTRDSVQIAVVDGLTRAQHQVLPYDVRSTELSYEPTTRLLAASIAAGALLLRYDPATHTFGNPIRLARDVPPSKLVVLDPRLAGGVAALVLDMSDGGLFVGELHQDDLTPGAAVRPRATYRVPGVLQAFDRAGRLYLHDAADGDDVLVWTRGVATARLPGVATMTLRPNADGSQIAAFEGPRLVLLGGTGAIRWDTMQWNSVDITWMAPRELAVQFASAVATLDLETGAIARRRCGLAFGLSDQGLEVGRGSPSICDVAR